MYDERIKSLRTDGLSDSPTRPMSDRITMGASSTYDRLMMSMGTQKGGASSSTRLQPQLTSSSLGLTPVLGTASYLIDMFAAVKTGLEELRRDMTKRLDRVEERYQQGQEKLRDELAGVKSQAKTNQAQLIRNTDQCLAERLALAAKESEERDIRMTREIERLLNVHDDTYVYTMTSLEKRLDAKSELMIRKLDEILNESNREKRPSPREDSCQATDGDGARSRTGAQSRSRTNFESNHRKRPRTAPSRPGWTNSVPPEEDATSGTRLPIMPQVRSVHV